MTRLDMRQVFVLSNALMLNNIIFLNKINTDIFVFIRNTVLYIMHDALVLPNLNKIYDKCTVIKYTKSRILVANLYPKYTVNSLPNINTIARSISIDDIISKK